VAGKEPLRGPAWRARRAGTSPWSRGFGIGVKPEAIGMEAHVRAGPETQRRPEPAGIAGLRVALVHDWLTGMRGGEKCLEVLCKAFPGATLHTLLHRRGVLSAPIEQMTVRTTPLERLPGVLRYYRHLLPIMPLAARSWDVGSVDLVVSLSHCVAKAVRVPSGVPHVCYCFTPMRYAWEGREVYLESWRARPIRRAAAAAVLDRLRAWDRATAARVTHFVAISETVRERIARCYGRESRVIAPPVETGFYTPANVPREGMYLCVSALVPYKRVDHAVRACSISGRTLVVIGAGPERARLEALAGPSVQFLGWQPDEVVRDHYRRCRALLFPGEEDFGIVPAEALACAAPVIALGRGGAAETVDNAVGRTYQEPSPEALLACLEEWETEGCPHDPALARQRALGFAAELFRDKLLGLLAEVAGANRGARGVPAPHRRPGRRQRKPFESQRGGP
jgi:glycosyltransferase involved in cell wall biosynthesis